MPGASTLRDLTNAPLDDLLARAASLGGEYLAVGEWMTRNSDIAKFSECARAHGQLAEVAWELELIYRELSRRGLDRDRPGASNAPGLN